MGDFGLRCILSGARGFVYSMENVPNSPLAVVGDGEGNALVFGILTNNKLNSI